MSPAVDSAVVTEDGGITAAVLYSGDASETAPLIAGFEPPFSVFTRRQKLWICFAVSFAAMFSTLCSYIYYPALLPISREFGVSLGLINLTVTSYMLVAGFAPAFMGDLSDHGGRRPVYILMFSLLIGSCIGIALENSYPALLILRMAQSAGSSGLVKHPMLRPCRW